MSNILTIIDLYAGQVQDMRNTLLNLFTKKHGTNLEIVLNDVRLTSGFECDKLIFNTGYFVAECCSAVWREGTAEVVHYEFHDSQLSFDDFCILIKEADWVLQSKEFKH